MLRRGVQGRAQRPPGRRRRAAALTLMALAALISACSTGPATNTQTVRGVLIDVQARGLQQLDSFTIRTDAGQELTFVPAQNFNQGEAHAMTPGHMRQHM